MTNGANPTVHKRQLGMALTALREKAGKSVDDVAALLECSSAKIRRVECGDVAVRASELKDVLDFFSATKTERRELEDLGREARKRAPHTPYGAVLPDFFRKFFSLEQIAAEILLYHAEIIPGQFQTPEYARALIEANPTHEPEEIDRLIQARQTRLSRITRDEDPQRQHVVLHEAAIRTMVGGPVVMKDQLLYLRKLASMSNVTIQVIPFSAGAHAATGLPFILLRFPDNVRNAVYLESLTSANSLDDPAHVAQYEMTFRHVVGAAFSPTKTSALLATVAGEL
ncbi:helix-turn-helix transcriptional regulator [Saccharothrix violaceirubra]|uniref:Transcriptional regulator with XRE-family HTH domain n=1 Tax=Saccharothrix violaceirubra TaxID=413306 RepID=A0A7W7T5S0_9PSEU|nr:helix-turn-helix transcriptional regulator [Saccharothrix violaceirubra]MBB4967071.1 transcriptional regulator with XRE-family HTH domain [Saccharothrix violaceirubra]